MDPLNPLPPERVVWSEHLHGGQAWSFRLRRGTSLRVTALGDGANVAFQAWNAEQPLERWNMPDTLKEQYCAYLTAPRILMTDMGRVLLSMTADACGWHDCFSGVAGADEVAAKYGVKTYQDHRNDRHRNGRDNLLIEMMKHGLALSDLGSTLNLFSKVQPDGAGRLTHAAGHAKRGQYVDLRAEMDALVVLTTLQHPLDPNPVYAPVPVHLTIWRSDRPGADDPCRIHRPENHRAFARTEACFP